MISRNVLILAILLPQIICEKMEFSITVNKGAM